jgi:hypothetical protein
MQKIKFKRAFYFVKKKTTLFLGKIRRPLKNAIDEPRCYVPSEQFL